MFKKKVFVILKKLIYQQEWYTFVFFKKWKNMFRVDTLRKKHKSFRKHTISWLFSEIQNSRLPFGFCVLMHSADTINGILFFFWKHEVAWAQRVQQNFQTLKSRSNHVRVICIKSEPWALGSPVTFHMKAPGPFS